MVESGCITDYDQSDIKYVIDAWKVSQAPVASSARLITIDDLVDNLGYEQDPSVATQKIPNSVNTPSWVYDANYCYWSMSQYDDSTSHVWYVYNYSGDVGFRSVNDINDLGNCQGAVVRPVITIHKSYLN